MPGRTGLRSAKSSLNNELLIHKTVRVTDPGPVVFKFGGTSLQGGPRILASARLVAAAEGTPVVVVSAMAGVTTELTRIAALPSGTTRNEALEALLDRHRDAARELLEEVGSAHPGSSVQALDLEERIETIAEGLAAELGAESDTRSRTDALVARGEDLSAALMTSALQRLGIPAREIDARKVVRTDAGFGQAVPRDEVTVRLAWKHLFPLVSQGVVPVMQGFIGADDEGRTTTLGRGGSDFTAAIVGAALEVRQVTIWTDVDGIYSADPNRIPGARIIAELGFEEAVELAYFGARVIHPAAAKHAVARGVSLRIRNSFNAEAPGTLIRSDRRESPGVAALAYKPGTALIRVRSRPHFMAYGFLARVFEVLTRHGVPVDLVATSHTSTAFTVDRGEELGAVEKALQEVAEVTVVDGLGTVSAIGRGLLETPGVTGEIFRVLGSTPIHLISQASDTSLSFLVSEAEGPDVVRRLHEVLVEGRDA